VTRAVPQGRRFAESWRVCWCTACLFSGLVGANIFKPDEAYAAGAAEDVHSPPAALSVGSATIDVEWQGPAPDVGESGLLEWLARSADIVRRYYEEFPVRTATIRISITEGDHMGNGRTFGLPRPYIEVSVGRHITARALTDDWVLVHEMIHLSLPAVADAQNWLAEGIATYVEGIARTQAGNMTAVDLWTEYLEAMPKGLPQPNDRGLDRTHTHARTYWGGALYCLIADVRIRERTNSRYGLQDALRAIRGAGAGMSSEWPIERILTTGDAATGTTVLRDLYVSMRDRPVAPDLDALWSELGIHMSDGVVRFDDSARLAVVRRAITRAPATNAAPDR
jgi:hypothetical protein